MKVAAYIMELLGLVGVFYGIWAIYPPAAYIVAGLLLVLGAQTLDKEPKP